MWFKNLTGFKESSADEVRKQLILEGDEIISLANSRRFSHGRLEIPSLEELRSKVHISDYNKKIKVNELVDDALALHCDGQNENALFQVASQFNLLEMISPGVTPEMGIDRYEEDLTQGPFCAIACGAGTIYRNYFVEVNGQIGQTENNQIDCLELMGEALGNEGSKLWTMKNGYALASKEGLIAINSILDNQTEVERDIFKGKLKTGIQWQTGVTLGGAQHNVSQIYCSALPLSYSVVNAHYWERFARLVLEALYESTLYAGVLNMQQYQSNKVYLTLVGGGAFGNDMQWILDAISKALKKFEYVPLDVKIVSHRSTNPRFQELFSEFT